MDKGNINTEVQSTEKSQIFGQKILESMEFQSRNFEEYETQGSNTRPNSEEL